jgi:hypothetical protein
MNLPTVALVLETNNLRSSNDRARVCASLARLLTHLSGQTRPLAELAELVVTHDGFDAAERAALERAAGVPITFVELPPDTGYYQAKNLGFDATSADVVAFGDADCWPARTWLERLLAPFADRRTAVVAGRTTYRDDLLGAAATSIDFMYFPSPLGEACTRNFYANNVAFRRDVFAQQRYHADEHIYRGHCQRLGLRLVAAGVPVRFEPEAHTVHRFPDDRRELLSLRLLRGADTAEMAPHFAAALLPPGLAWLGRLGPLSPLGVLGVRLALSARALGHQGLTPVHGGRRVAALGVMAALSAADAAGALARSVAGVDFGVLDGGLARGALGYHGDADRLARA